MRGAGGGPPRQQRVPVQPLIRALISHGAIEPDPTPTTIGRAVGLSREVVHRAIQAGQITIWAADKAAVTGLNVHPVLIWGEEWLDQEWLHSPSVDRQARTYHEAMQLRLEARQELAR